MYISMVHLDLEHCLDDIIRKICKIFKGRNYLYYITFDYSGIIVLAKNDTVKEYARKLLKLNYFCQNEMRIQDTFSVFSFNKRSLKTLFYKYAQKGNGKKDIKDEDKDKGEDKYLISVNISVKDLGLYQKFKKKLKKFEKKIKGSISFKVSKKPNRKPELPVMLTIEAFEKKIYPCCKKEVKLKPILKMSGSYCPYCGVMDYGFE